MGKRCHTAGKEGPLRMEDTPETEHALTGVCRMPPVAPGPPAVPTAFLRVRAVDSMPSGNSHHLRDLRAKESWTANVGMKEKCVKSIYMVIK